MIVESPGSVSISGRVWDFFPVVINEMGLPGGPHPISCYVSFADPEDTDLSVEARQVPMDEADMNEEGLRRIFARAKHRRWRSADGTLWAIQHHPGIAVGARHEADDAKVQPQPSLIRFRSLAFEGTYHVRVLGFESLGQASDEDLEDILASARTAK